MVKKDVDERNDCNYLECSLFYGLHSPLIAGFSLNIEIARSVDNRLQEKEEEFPVLLFDEFLVVDFVKMHTEPFKDSFHVELAILELL